MNKVDIAENLFEAVDVILDQRIKKLKFSQCYLMEVIEETKTVGVYSVKYQGHKYKALGTGYVYHKGDMVWVLAPRNTLEDELTITGIVSLYYKPTEQMIEQGASYLRIGSAGGQWDVSSRKVDSFSMALGLNSTAGARGFRYSIMEKNTAANTTTFTCAGDITSALTTEDTCTIFTFSEYQSHGKPIAIIYDSVSNTTKVTFKGTSFQDDATVDLIADPYKKTIRVDGKPYLGDVDVGLNSIAIGINNKAQGYASFVTGRDNVATAAYAFIEGRNNQAGYNAHAEGRDNMAQGDASHAEGSYTQALGKYAHAEGQNTVAQGDYSHVEGKDIQALASGAHAEGGLLPTEEATYNRKVKDSTNTERQNDGFAHGEYSHREGRNTSTYGNYSHTEGSGTMALGNASHAEGYNTTAINSGSHAEGYCTSAVGKYSHTEGGDTKAEGEKAHAEGSYSTAAGNMSHAEGINTKAGVFARTDISVNSDTSNGRFTHAEGNGSIAMGNSAHAEGKATFAGGNWSHAEGFNSQTGGRSAHAEGDNTRAAADGAHAEGTNIKAADENQKPVYHGTRSAYYIKGGYNVAIEGSLAYNRGSHAEGVQTFAGEYATHAEGYQTDAVGQASHAEGWQTRAEGKASHATGIGTIAKADAQTVVGEYNDDRDDVAKFVVGVGSATNRQNAFTTGNDGTNDYITIGDTKITERQLQSLLSLI